MKKKYLIILAFILLNVVLIPRVHAYDSGREIYVRHIEKAGDIIPSIANATQEEITAAGTSSLVSKTASTDAIMNYSEYYNIPIESTMSITKSLVVRANGQSYKYLGYNVCTTNSLIDSYNIAEQKKQAFNSGTATLDRPNDNTEFSAQFNIMQSNNNDVTIIDFYYTKEAVGEITPKLLSYSSAYNSSVEDGTMTEVTYVPAGARLYPYFVTSEYAIKDLSYTKVIKEGRVDYEVNNFKVYMIDNSQLVNGNVTTIDGKDITANIFGSQKEAIADIANPFNVAFQESSKQRIRDELDGLLETTRNNTQKIPGNNNLDNQTSGKTNKYDMNQVHGDAEGIIVSHLVVNGLRSCNGNVSYSEYDVLNKSYTGGGITVNSTNEHFVNVYTPVKINTPEIKVLSSQDINHSATSSSTIILPDDATFQMALSCGDSDFQFYNNLSESDKQKYISNYLVMFDFPVIDAMSGDHYNVGDVILLDNTADFYGGYTYKTFKVDPSVSLSKTTSEHKVIVFALTQNYPKVGAYNMGYLQYLVDQEERIQLLHTQSPDDRKMVRDTGTNAVSFSTDVRDAESYNLPEYNYGIKMYGDAHYAAMSSLNIKTVSKMYDFKISDCNDLAFKSVFRDSSSTNINEHSKYYFYSGIRRMVVYESNNKEYSTLVNRKDENSTNPLYINGTSATATLPLGPYKHTTASYVNAPKLGYRISYDVKTTGYYTANGTRRIKITPSYYFISKDGSELIKEIDLYYKDQSGKYRKFEGSDYTIFFTPNDGYRFKNSSVTAHTDSMSTIEEPLDIASPEGYFYLTDKMMTSDSANYIQCWYGEFKLPNTTIAVRKGDSLDKKLQNGYIAVKFGLSCTDTTLSETMSYEMENKNANTTINTTQWDYEGYLGFANPGQEVTPDTSLRLQLEKGIWSISKQDVYEFVRGTVVLFDADQRAADDIQ